MSKPKSVRIADHFAELTDPRRREVIYPLINVGGHCSLRGDLWCG
jgi:hypothetical protein